MADRLPNRDSIRRSLDLQPSSPFFTLLPAEIRNLIYAEFFRLSSPRQHIIHGQSPDEHNPAVLIEQWGHKPCITDPTEGDIRIDKFLVTDPMSTEGILWGDRLASEWCLHWACEEQGTDSQDAAKRPAHPVAALVQEAHRTHEGDSQCQSEERPSPLPAKTGYLHILTACKRMYLECLPSLYGNTTFVFTDTRTAGDFLERYGGDVDRYPLRSLEICIRVTNIITEMYYPHGASGSDEGPPAVFAGRARPSLSMKNNPWQRLCDRLVEQPNLQDLRIWLDSSDLRPWHKRVSETRFFATLFDVRVPDKSRFVLGLPELPERRGPDSQALEGHYLEGEKAEMAPFTIERAERPNNWRVHLRNIVRVGAGAQAGATPLMGARNPSAAAAAS